MSLRLYANVLTAAVLATLAGCANQDSTDLVGPSWTATRSDANPLLTTETEGMVAEHGFPNVNGPSVIRVPSWIENPLGRYYMYFAHHRGSFIRLAYADSVEGPWTVWGEAALHLDDTPALDHVASPDVHVYGEEKTIRMFFHAVDDTASWWQTTYLAVSSDGLHFASQAKPIGPPYLRVFKIGRTWWGIAKVRGGPGGVLLRSERPEGPFRVGPRIIPNMRHAAVLVTGNIANVFFSRIGDAPERLLVTSFNPKRRWIDQNESVARDVLWPQQTYEGANLLVTESTEGEASSAVRALRDPFVFSDEGRDFLFYSIAGESGIAVASLTKR